MKEKFNIEKVLRLRNKCVRVKFANLNNETFTIDFADKYGQYSKFKSESKRGETYAKEYLEMYTL